MPPFSSSYDRRERELQALRSAGFQVLNGKNGNTVVRMISGTSAKKPTEDQTRRQLESELLAQKRARQEGA